VSCFRVVQQMSNCLQMSRVFLNVRHVCCVMRSLIKALHTVFF